MLLLGLLNSIKQMSLSITTGSVVDLRHIDADPDPTYPDADPYPDIFEADPDPSFQIKGQNLANAQIGSYSIQFCCQLQASADPDALWMRIRVPKMMRIQSNLDTDPQH